MHMGESKQQPRALLGEQWAAHSPTRAPDFITGLSIPPAWELWDLGQAAAADRSTLTHHTQQPAGEDPLTAAYLQRPHCPPLICPFTHSAWVKERGSSRIGFRQLQLQLFVNLN